MNDQFKTYIKAVGTGPKGNRDLNFEEMYQCMKMILNGEASDNQISAFLLGWRLKPETIEEYLGALKAIDDQIKLKSDISGIELGFPFDGKNDSPYLLKLTAKILKNFDLPIIVMGDDLVPSKNGRTIKNIYSKVQIENFFYFDRLSYLPEVSKLSDLRMDLGVRTAFNTLEKLPKLTKSEFAVTGVFHKPYVEKYNKIFGERYKRFALLQGNEGSPEIFRKGKLWITENNITEEFLIDPEAFCPNFDKINFELSANELQKMADEEMLPMRELACLNAAIYLIVAKKVSTLAEAFRVTTKYMT